MSVRRVTFAVLCLHGYCSYALFEGCNHFIELKEFQKIYINSPYYPDPLPRGTSCRYTVEAPIDFKLKLTCALNFNVTNSSMCNSEVFYYNNEGSELLSGSDFFCGSGTIKRKSQFNRATISYISSDTNNTTKGGRFSCFVESIKSPCDCGYVSSTSPRIVGGSEATPGEFPSLAAVFRKVDLTLICGATIIHHRYLISAAHCYTSIDVALPSLIEIGAGKSDISAVYDPMLSQKYNIEKIIIHKHFRLVNLMNDIALLRTVTDIKWNRVVIPACLPFRFTKKSLNGYTVRAAGWGTTSFGGQRSYKLLKTSLNILSYGVCKESISSVTLSQFCTSTQSGDTCQNDSGGGLFLKTNRIYTVGIVSYGYGCGGEIPSVNVRLTSYLNWVRSNSNKSIFCIK